MKRRLLLVAFCVAVPINAEELFPRFGLTGGAYRGGFSTVIRADNNALAGTQLNAERDLGLARSEHLQRFGIQWRPFECHEFAASWFHSARSGFQPINAPITYTGWLHRSDRFGVGLNVGVAALAVDASLFARRPGQTLTITGVGIDARAGRVHIDVYSGHAVTGSARLEYRLLRHLGAGAR